MKPIEKVAIIGLGAIGSVYATAFYNTGMSPTIIVDRDRMERYKNDGLIFNNKRYDFHYATPEMAQGAVDLIIIAVKSSGLLASLDLIEQFVGPRTIILPLLNGISSERICAQKDGWDRVLYGYFIGHTASRDANRVSQDGQYTTYFGEGCNEIITPRVKAIQDVFDRASIPYKTPKDMIQSLWQKFVMNVGLNQTTAVLQKKYGQLHVNPHGHALMIELMKEATAVAKAEGVNGTEIMVEKGASLLDSLSADDGSSMYQDVMNNRPTEIDLFGDSVCELGAKHGIKTPYNFYVGQIIKALLT